MTDQPNLPAAVPECPPELAEARQMAGRMMVRIVQHSVEIGGKLQIAKDRVGHGNWLVYVRAYWPWGERSCQEFLNIAKNPAILRHAELLPPDVTSLAKIAELKEPEIDQSAGKQITPTSTREAVASHVRRSKLARKARVEAAKRRARGLPPKPPALTGDAAKDAAKARAAQRADELALIAEMPEEEIEALGPIAGHHGDLVQYLKFTRDYQLAIITAIQAGGCNRLKGAIAYADAAITAGRGQAMADPATREAIAQRIAPALVRLPDILQPVISLMGQLRTAMKKAAAAVQAIKDGEEMQLVGAVLDPRILGKIPAYVGQARVDQLDAWLRDLTAQIPYCGCPTCDGNGDVMIAGGTPAHRVVPDAEKKPCASCRGVGWHDMGTSRKRKADAETTSRMRGESEE